MSNGSDKPPEHFVHVKDEKEAALLLREAAKTAASTLIWTKNQEQQIATRLSGLEEDSKEIYAWAPPGFDTLKFMDTLAEKNLQECYFSVNLERATVFFRCKFKTAEETGIVFHYPEKVFKVQRRKDLRLPIFKDFLIKIEFDDPLEPGKRMSKRCLDLSAGGLAVLIGEEDQPVFPNGSSVERIAFTIKGRKITCDGEVRHCQKLPTNSPHKGLKLGIAFKNIKSGDADFISGYVFEESRKYFTRLF